MREISPQTKSFILLFLFAFLGVALSLKLWSELNFSTNYYSDYYYRQPAAKKPEVSAFSKVTPVDTSTWQTYSNKDLGLSFKYKPEWKILPPVKKAGFTVLQVDPGKKFYNIKIYIHPKEFYILDGLPTMLQTIGGAKALNVNNDLYGIVANNLHYTFDVGVSMSLVSDFNGLVKSVNFGG